MKTYITIDGGTTNTRIYLVQDRKVLQTEKINAGARAGMENKDFLKCEIKKAIEKILKDNNLCESDIEKILASGMITSEFGLCNLNHINAPCTLKELHDNMHETVIEEISQIPFVFIRGVKIMSENLSDCDMMRGEETELFGIMTQNDGECIYVLPGSHSKIIFTDKEGSITNFSTMLTGEMIFALSQSTILKDAVDLSLDGFDAEYLLKGYDMCKNEGINKTLFKTRVLKNILGADKIQTYSFFLGCVLCDEIKSIIESTAKSVVVGGKQSLKEAMCALLRQRDTKNVISLEKNKVDISTCLGAIRIYENKI